MANILFTPVLLPITVWNIITFGYAKLQIHVT